MTYQNKGIKLLFLMAGVAAGPAPLFAEGLPPLSDDAAASVTIEDIKKMMPVCIVNGEKVEVIDSKTSPLRGYAQFVPAYSFKNAETGKRYVGINIDFFNYYYKGHTKHQEWVLAHECGHHMAGDFDMTANQILAMTDQKQRVKEFAADCFAVQWLKINKGYSLAEIAESLSGLLHPLYAESPKHPAGLKRFQNGMACYEKGPSSN